MDADARSIRTAPAVPAVPAARTVRARVAAGSRWAGRSDVVAALRKRWATGEYLRAIARGTPWSPIVVPLGALTAVDLARDYAAVQDWATRWQRPDRGLRVESRRVGGRLIGVNEVPGRVWVDTPEALWSLLGVRDDVRSYREILDQVGRDLPGAIQWVGEHPLDALGHAHVWPLLIGVVRWMRDDAPLGASVRQIDAPGVDTKFVERHRAILTDLLDACLPPDRIDPCPPRHRFASRYRLASKPSYLRLRRLDGDGLYPALPMAELGVRTADLARQAVPCSRIFVVENETTYLAFPPVPDAVVAYGAGYAVSLLAPIAWLADRELVYWGDIDTHGFAILDQLRAHFGSVRSILMDRDTLLAHEAHWTSEPEPKNVALDRLIADEAALYADLVEGAYGPRLRLEQERVRFSAVAAALSPWTGAG